MKCSHCGFSCTSRGKNMSLSTFKKALKIAEDYGSPIAIGGGEPTVNPLFWEILGLAVINSENSDNIPWLATNGKKTKDALRLAKLAKRGLISCELSLDEYHEKIDDKVVAAFQNDNRHSSFSQSNDYRGVRNTTKHKDPVESGRCTEGTNECICEDIFIMPNGNIKQRGCLDSPIIGNVDDGLANDFPSSEWRV